MITEVINGQLSPEEIAEYEHYVRVKYKRRVISKLTISVDGEFVDLKCQFAPQDFERIRRITGYLVGTLDRFNDGKRAEEHERVKHTVTE